MPRFCVNNADNFCYICGEVTFASQKREITPVIKQAYHLYFGCKIGDQEKSWAPHIVCNSCTTRLRSWLNGKGRSMPFAIPMVWREPSNHVSDCYFCMTPPLGSGITKKKKQTINYPNIPSAIRPVSHGENLPVPEPPEHYEVDLEEEEKEETGTQEMAFGDGDFTHPTSDSPHKITQNEMNDLVRDLELSKSKAELLGSRLQQWNLLDRDVKVSVYRSRQEHLALFFTIGI